MFYQYIERLPYKYGLFNYLNETDLKQTYTPHNLSEENMFVLISAYKKSTLVHYIRCYPKHWEKNSLIKIIQRQYEDIKIWYNYANKTDYYKEIYDKYMKNISFNKTN